jgi:NAD-dependent SIR2 family protein deacetylase
VTAFSPATSALLDRAAAAIRSADALLIGAGAGMGVDSGLPDFRGPEGFWKAYPPYARLGLHFADLASPHWFSADPHLAWGFYGHRLNLYRRANPHDGFRILFGWSQRMRQGCFVFTSNVDGHFQRAGFEDSRVLEVHGSIHFLQCTRLCSPNLFPSDAFSVSVEESSMRARDSLPACPNCGAMARPNILMFGDWQWERRRAAAQEANLETWLRELNGARLAIIECGAGTSIPTVRVFCEEMADRYLASLIRINLREPEVPKGHIALAMGSAEALASINQRI